MNESVMPKWERELKYFLGIKTGIILEGNVYDEFPMFDANHDQFDFVDTDDLDHTILSLIDYEQTDTIFFDPIDGFYCYENSVDKQREVLEGIFEGYGVCEIIKEYDNRLCMMPATKKKSCKGDEEGKYVWISEIIRRVMTENKCNCEDNKNTVFVMNFASRLDACNISNHEANSMFLNFLEATTKAVQSYVYLSNSIVWIVDKYNDIPTWVYLNNPNVRTISISIPDRECRRLYLENVGGRLKPYRILGDVNSDIGKSFVSETEGMKLQEIKQILLLASKKNIIPVDIDKAFSLFKYGVPDNPWEKLGNNIIKDISDNLDKRVKGQDEALKKVKAIIGRAIKGLSGLQHSNSSHKPKGIMFFAGPTGVGKTETAKALAEGIFGDENAFIRFDMSEYREAHSDQKLFGAPPGYVGYEGGGQLTNAIKSKPFSILLFDEIEKAHSSIMDKFLQILEDGRMTDNQGNTVYFGETIIIFTSNIGLTKDDENDNNVASILNNSRHQIPTITIENPMEEDTDEFKKRTTEILSEGVKAYFYDNGRPELLNRLGENNIIVFQFIDKNDAVAICNHKLEDICDNISSKMGISISYDLVLEYLHTQAIMTRANGGRGVGNMLEKEFLNPLSEALNNTDNIPKMLRPKMGDSGIVFEEGNL